MCTFVLQWRKTSGKFNYWLNEGTNLNPQGESKRRYHLNHIGCQTHECKNNVFNWSDILFNDGHVLHLRSETVAVRRRMNVVLDENDCQMIPGDECGLNVLTFALQLRKPPGENFNQEIDPIWDRTWAQCIRGTDVIPRPQRWSYLIEKCKS